MKSEKKPRGIKYRIREEKGQKRIALGAIVVILISIIFICDSFINSMLNQPPLSQPDSSTLQPKAVIVDHLSLTYPNQTFTQTATNNLKQAGFTVDYVKGEEVTVEFFRNLPTHNYELIILRVHSIGGLYLLTSQPYTNAQYSYEQLTNQIGKASYNGTPPFYFHITPAFVRSNMQGRLRNATIIMMGCNGLTTTDMASAFVEKGAKAYISWMQPVSAPRTDLATIHLLEHFLIEKQTIREAVRETMQDIGADPEFHSLLTYYPPEAENYTIQNIVGNLVAKDVEIKTKTPCEKRKITH